MDVRFSPEQVALRDSVAQVVGKLGPKAVGELDDAERAAKLDAAIASSGWRELRAATDDGTPWSSAVEAAIVAEELGRGLADAPYLGPTLAADLRRLAGVPVATGAETVVLRPRLDELARSREPGVAVDAAGAHTAVLLDSEQRLVEVTLTNPREHIDLTRPSVAVASTATVKLLPGVLDAEALERWIALGLALTTADLVGAMQGAVHLARDYAVERRQYGAAIGSFQAVQHLLADAFVATEGARSAALHAAWAVDALAPADALAAGALAKAYAARAARSVCETAIQVHGGIGNTWDCLAHVHLRRVLLASDVLGDAGRNLTRTLAHHGIGRS
jgi:alkylation response protein AidB-like acyl-CoA dehydrogenase